MGDKLFAKDVDYTRVRLNVEGNILENKDYISLTPKGEREIGATTRLDYILKLNIAKEMAMLERNEIGKEYRRYFIEMETKYTSTEWVKQGLNEVDTIENNDFISFTQK